MSKLLYLDTETTGLDAEKNGLTQVAAIVVVDGEELGRIDLDINPLTYNRTMEISEKALEVTGKTMDLLCTYPDQGKQLHKFVAFLENYISLEDKKDQFQIAGYNTSFDIGFIKVWFKMNGLWFNSCFSYKDVDVFALVKHMRLWGMLDGCKNDQLGTVCEHFGIEIDAHDALNDVVATRELYKYLTVQISNFLEVDLDDAESLSI